MTTARTVPVHEWRWFGSAGHLIVSHRCRFHLCTQVGAYLVSTVGEYVPDETAREIHCQTSGITLIGRGDARLLDYMHKVGFQEIGLDRTYETMVFRAGPPCAEVACGQCGLPTPTEWGELDAQGYRTAGDATRGHYALCEKWAALR